MADELDNQDIEDFENITINDNGTITVSLTSPVRLDVKKSGEIVEKLFEDVTFRPLGMGDLKAMGQQSFKNQISEAYWIVDRLSNIPSPALDKIAGEDMEACMIAVSHFSQSSRKT